MHVSSIQEQNIIEIKGPTNKGTNESKITGTDEYTSEEITKMNAKGINCQNDA